MWYVPYLRVRRAVIMYACFAGAIVLLAVALHFWPGGVHLNAHNGNVAQNTPQHSGAMPEFSITIAMLLSAAAALVAGLATVLGLNLAAENDGHLELAWTKPISRTNYALGVFAVDIGAMAVCLVITVFCAALIIDVFSGRQAIAIGPGDALWQSLLYCGFPLCVYAWITALSASLKRNRGTVAGLFWPILLVLGALSVIPIASVHAVVTALNAINPADIYSIGSHAAPSLWTYAWGWAVAALLLTAALVQWRRLEL